MTNRPTWWRCSAERNRQSDAAELAKTVANARERHRESSWSARRRPRSFSIVISPQGSRLARVAAFAARRDRADNSGFLTCREAAVDHSSLVALFRRIILAGPPLLMGVGFN